MNSYNDQVKESYGRLLWPILIEQIFMMLIGNVNVFLLSLYTDQAVAATGLADQVLSIGTMAMGIVSLGSTILFLQNAEDKRLPYVQGVTRQTLALNIVLSLGLVLITTTLGNFIMRWMQTPAELHTISVLYLRIVSASLLFQSISTTASALLRAYGKVKEAMSISILNTLLIITGNAIVILTPLGIFGQGILGISVATVVTRIAGGIISVLSVRYLLPEVWQGITNYQHSDWVIGRQILKLGVPSGMENVSYNLSQTIITAAIASLGTSSVNARIYTQTITAIVFTIAVAAGQAGQIVLGRFLRHGEIEDAKQFALRNSRQFMSIGLVINLAIALMGPMLLRIFTEDPEIIRIASILLWLNCIYDPMRVGNETIIASMNVTGDVRYPVIVGMLVTYIFTVPAALLISSQFTWGIIGIWIIFILDESVRFTLFLNRWIKGRWINLLIREERS